MHRILLVRHGDAAGDDSVDPALSGTGRARDRWHWLHETPADAWLRLPVANADLTDLRRRPSGEWAVHSMSDVCHLVGLAGESS
ncbi:MULTISPECIES: hypothetical protein [unclassified Brachybacterium]|uniref:hypothetical protein n=1 Tax=unclassified Brachybacterium TaxID=2623841 RepID=UPI0040343C9A